MQQSDKLTRLTTQPIGRLLWEYSLPAVVGVGSGGGGRVRRSLLA